MKFRKTMTQEAWEAGQAKGIELGIEKGISQGQRELLLGICQKRFKNFPVESIRRQIETMSVAEIEEFEERLLIAQSPAELGLID